MDKIPLSIKRAQWLATSVHIAFNSRTSHIMKMYINMVEETCGHKQKKVVSLFYLKGI
jgi:hypothetical protein